jgi:hypothetical protein
MRQFDKRCTTPLQKGARPESQDLNIEFRLWANFFTMEAIVDIGLSNILGFLDRGEDQIISESVDGSLSRTSYRESIHALLTAQSHLVWAYHFFQVIWEWVPRIVPKYRELIRLGSEYEGIVIHQMRKRMERYQKGEKLDDFFQAIMEGKDGNPHLLPFGEIYAELSVMSASTFHVLISPRIPTVYITCTNWRFY